MDNNLGNSTTTQLRGISDYKVATKSTDGVTQGKETYYDNDNFTTNFGYYKTIPELKAAVNALVNWTVGKGYEADDGTIAQLDRVTGMGEDTFESIMWNMLVVKKINGDAYAEIIRNDEDDLINLKPLDPSSMRTVVNSSGRIIRYEQRDKTSSGENKRFKPNQILHLMNDRVADEIHGTSVVEACKWVIDARNEAMSDWRRISHRSTIRVMYVDMDSPDRLNTVRDQYKEAIKNGELLILPAKRGDIEFEELTAPPVESFMRWIEYLENFFYTAVGVPKVVLGGSSEFTEASSKIAFITYDQAWNKEQMDLEKDLYNQCGIIVQFNKPASLISEAITSEEKNTGQTGFQQNDIQSGSGKDNPTNTLGATT